ncbi:serine/Arginine-related protein 53 [Bradysia coprophila]|uniref:serine/Arginine-related protein 53 n=1 Tax=Bradysia coprophila TaxID=38358 RepID=UPI00187DA0E1|nr:serine/Arginine-related protein 53 [Bradysia coprophila]
MPHSGSPSRKKRSRDNSKDRRHHRRSKSRSVGSRSSKHSKHYYKKRSRTPSYHRSKYSSSKQTGSRSTSTSYRSVTPERHRSHKRSSRERRRRRSSSSSDSSSTSSYSEHSSSSVSEVKVTKDNKKKSSRIPTPPPPPITQNFTSVDLLDEPATQETIDLINEDEFVPKTFTSSKNLTDKVVIDLNTQTIIVPTPDTPDDVQNTLFHPNLFGDDAARMEKWVKKLFNYRQKLFFGSN